MPNRYFPLDHKESKGPDAHNMSYEDAMRMTTEMGPKRDGIKRRKKYKNLTFHADAVKGLLAHPDAKGLRLYPAQNGEWITTVLVAVDERGLDIPSAGALDSGQPCPPRCIIPPIPVP